MDHVHSNPRARAPVGMSTQSSLLSGPIAVLAFSLTMKRGGSFVVAALWDADDSSLVLL